MADSTPADWPICPVCGAYAERSHTSYGERFEHCARWAWGRFPLADRETHEARKAAHRAFDRLWKDKLMTRDVAYEWLAEEMGLTRAECHMKQMDAATARAVPAATLRVLDRFEALLDAVQGLGTNDPG